MRFVALDFETACYEPHSACALGLVRVEDGAVVSEEMHLIRPPRNWFVFTDIHGITWDDVKDAPSFDLLWPRIEPLFRDIDFAAAHNASFDRRVLEACCAFYGITPPRVPFRCTMRIARTLWQIRPTKLPDVCRRFGIPLTHHEALSDTKACAQIMLRALKEESSPL